MAREDRLRLVSYESPSGKKFSWNFTNLSRSVEQKGAEFVFPEVDGSYIQQKGVTGTRLPMLCLFNGDDCDIQADAFMDALAEKGTGILDHPRYGRLNVVPFGEITQRDDLVDADNESAIEVTFYVTINLIYPISVADARSKSIALLETMNETYSQSFAGRIVASVSSEITSLRRSFSDVTNSISSAMAPIYKTQSNLNREMTALVDSVNDSITALAGDPYLFAKQCMQMTKLPANAKELFSNRAAAYVSLINTANATQIGDDNNVNIQKNNAATKHMFLVSSIYGLGYSTIGNQSVTRVETQSLLDLYNYLNFVFPFIVDSDNNSLGIVDDGSELQSFAESSTAIIANIITLMMDLPQQRAVILDRNRTIVDLAAELFGAVDDRLDSLIFLNNLKGEEFFELPRGKKIIYQL